MKKAMYIKFKFNLWFGRENNMTAEQFLKQVDLKSFATYDRWERTEEFKHITSIVLGAKQAEDLIMIYDLCKKKVENAKNPEPKDIEMLLKLQREINLHRKEAEKFFTSSEDKEEYDELDL